ncbi:hypothetical protein IWQ56_003282, partial [Coemansia nantahalensis]
AYDGRPARPGFMLDYLSRCTEQPKTVSIDSIWEVIVDGLAPVWPASRTQLDGVSLGDVWPCPALANTPTADGARPAPSPSSLVPFHKLSQWLTWSLLEAIVKLAKLTVSGTESLTGLPEYRNGGLLVDMGVLELNAADRERGLAAGGAVPQFDGGDPVIVEWRALTVVLLDKVAELVRQKCGLPDDAIPDMFLARVLEGGTWKAGREIAARLRGDSKDPPINIPPGAPSFPARWTRASKLESGDWNARMSMDTNTADTAPIHCCSSTSQSAYSSSSPAAGGGAWAAGWLSKTDGRRAVRSTRPCLVRRGALARCTDRNAVRSTTLTG